MSEHLTTTTSMGPRPIRWSSDPGRHCMEILGSRIEFSYEVVGGALWIRAETSGELRHPYLENWLTEPLRILLGAPVYPRMVARNLGDGTAHVWVRPAPRTARPSAIGLLQPFSLEHGRAAEFWGLYADLLKLIARASSFEAHELTRYYDELSEAQGGSNWVLALTLAGTAEALASGLMSDADRRSEFSDEALESMKRHVAGWRDDDRLRQRMLSSLAFVRRRGVAAFMRELAGRGVLDAADVAAWSELRNSVMHGNLVEPWSTQEGDMRLRRLLALVHALTRHRIAGIGIE